MRNNNKSLSATKIIVDWVCWYLVFKLILLKYVYLAVPKIICNMFLKAQ